MADVAERKPRKLVTNISDVIRPHWSRDGKWIYFRSNEPGRMGIYRCPASGGDAIALSKDIDGVSPQESFDGKTVYFASHSAKSTLKKVALPAQPGTESEVDGLPRLSGSDHWTLSPGGIYFVPADAPRSLRYFDFATRQLRPIFEVDKDFVGGLVGLSRWPLDPLFANWRRKQRHHARRSLSLALLHSLQMNVRSFTVSVTRAIKAPNFEGLFVHAAIVPGDLRVFAGRGICGTRRGNLRS